MKSGIYTITSSSGKMYVGSAVNFERRWAQHRYELKTGVHHNAPLTAAFAKYGLDGLAFQCLILCRKSDLLLYEQTAIDALNPEYNTCRVAGNTLGIRYSDEVKKKLSEMRTGMFKGVPKSIEHRAMISQAKSKSGYRGASACKKSGRWKAYATINTKQVYLGRYDTAEVAHAAVISAENASDFDAWLAEDLARRAALPSHGKGKPMSPEQKSKLSATKAGKNLGEKNHFFGKSHSAETRAKISAKNSGENHGNATAVVCIETGIQFPAMKYAEDWLKAHGGYPKASTSCIVLSCQTGCKRYGFHWQYANQ